MKKEFINLRKNLLEHLDRIHTLGKKVNGTTYILSAPACDDTLISSALEELSSIEQELSNCRDNVKAIVETLKSSEE